MHSADAREDLQPPEAPGALRAYALALLVHLLLAAALTWGVSWKSQDPEASFAAELWSATPQEAAPPLAQAAEPAESSPPAPVTPPAPPTPAPAAAAEAEAEAEIALQRERQRKRQEAEALKKAELAEKKKAEKEKADKAKAVAAAAAAAEKAEKEKTRKAQEAAAQAKARAAKDAEAKRQAQADTKQQAKEQAATEKLRQQNIARMMGMAGGTGAPDAKGTAAQASGPSASYGGRVRARVKPNVVFTEEIAGNPVAEVEVRTSIDGTIISQRLVKSSGNKAWDDAVIKAIIRTEVLPRDVDGRVPTPLIISFRPKD
jgi:colicin import membrane protein